MNNMTSITGFGSKFSTKVKELIVGEDDRETLFESLRKYQSLLELENLLAALRKLFNDPTKLELYEHIRPLILLKHQIEYSRKTPNMPGIKLRMVRLQRHGNDSLGFAVRGGFEHSVGVFISDVKPGSQADKKGLKAGDEIVRVNGFTISEAIHEDVLNLIKSRDEIMLKVTHIGMLPNKEDPKENISWSYVEKMDSSKALQEVLDGAGGNKNCTHGNELKIFINTAGANSIGCGILSGPNHFPGIFIEKVKPESLAEEAGLEVGDQIVEVNGTTFQGISHKEAVVTLKGSRQLDMVIRKKMGMVLFKSSQKNSQEPLQILSVNESHKDSILSSPTEKQADQRKRRQRSEDEVAPPFNEADLIQQHLALRHLSSNTDSSSTNYGEPDSTSTNYGEPDSSSTNYREPDSTSTNYREPDSTSTNYREPDSSSTNYGEPDSTSTNYGEPDSTSTNYREPDSTNYREKFQPNNESEDLDNIYSCVKKKTDANSLREELEDLKRRFQEEDIRGKDLQLVKLIKDKPLGIDVEGGIGTPLTDRIQVAEIYPDGCVFENGEIHIGDQLLMVDGKRLLNMSAAQARNILTEADNKTQDTIKIVIAKGFILNDEDAVTFF